MSFLELAGHVCLLLELLRFNVGVTPPFRQTAKARPAGSTRQPHRFLFKLHALTRCGSPHKVTQYKKGKDSLYAQGKRRYDRKQSGYGGQTKPVFHKKVRSPVMFPVRFSLQLSPKLAISRPRPQRRLCYG